ncbi:MAG TPA: hypothetical protein VF746_21815 [Longimicrobium sp.]|jgi:hypothetical protein
MNEKRDGQIAQRDSRTYLALVGITAAVIGLTLGALLQRGGWSPGALQPVLNQLITPALIVAGIGVLLKGVFQHSLDRDIESFKTRIQAEVEVYNNVYLGQLQGREQIFRTFSETISDFLRDVGLEGWEGSESQDRFYRRWFKFYTDLALVAPQNVMESLGNLSVYVTSVANGRQTYLWDDFEPLYSAFINDMRNHLDLHTVDFSRHLAGIPSSRRLSG